MKIYPTGRIPWYVYWDGSDFPISRAISPTLISATLVDVVPIDAPNGMIYYLDQKYENLPNRSPQE